MRRLIATVAAAMAALSISAAATSALAGPSHSTSKGGIYLADGSGGCCKN